MSTPPPADPAFVSLCEHLERLGLKSHEDPSPPVRALGCAGPGSALPEFRESATREQRDMVNAVIAGWPWGQGGADAAAYAADRLELIEQAAQAVAANDAFLALASPTSAQRLAQVEALTRQSNKVMKVLRYLLRYRLKE